MSLGVAGTVSASDSNIEVVEVQEEGREEENRCSGKDQNSAE